MNYVVLSHTGALGTVMLNILISGPKGKGGCQAFKDLSLSIFVSLQILIS